MLPLSSLGRNNELRLRGWYAVWCYAPHVAKRTVYHWQGSQSVANWLTHLSESDPSILTGHEQPQEREWAALNGGYFNYSSPRPGATQSLIGSVGNGRCAAWSDGSPPVYQHHNFQRWAFGTREQYVGASDFAISLMQPRPPGGKAGYWVPETLQRAYPFGLSGLLCLLRHGEPMVWQQGHTLQVEPPGQWDSSTEFRRGYYRRAAIAWTDDGKHLFLVVQHNPRSVLETRDLFATYRGRHYAGPGPILQVLYRAYAQLKPAERPCAPDELPQRIENAMLLDGGHSATLMYRRYVPSTPHHPAHWVDRGSWVTGSMWHPELPLVPTMIQVASK